MSKQPSTQTRILRFESTLLVDDVDNGDDNDEDDEEELLFVEVAMVVMVL